LDVEENEYEMFFNLFGFYASHIDKVKFYAVEKKRVLDNRDEKNKKLFTYQKIPNKTG
jgi:hypothetical protein